MTLRHALVPTYLAACVVLGGASAGGHLGNLLLQLLALPIIVWALLARPAQPLPRTARQLQILLLLLALLFALQLVPLPPQLWTLLPGRAWIAQGYAMLGLPLPWLPISLSPDRTIANFTWLLPAFAVLLAMLRLGAFQERWIAWTIAGTTILSVLVGAAQVGGGQNSPWYLYLTTNRGQAVGFFANSNHMATLLVATLPFLAGLYQPAKQPRRKGARFQGAVVILACAALVIVVGLALNSSLAGAGLAVPVVGMSLLLLRARATAVSGWLTGAVGALALAGAALIISGPFENNLTGPGAQSEISRQTSFSQSLRAGWDYFPLGAGIGSFQSIYRTQEDPAAAGTTYMNHVHSDLIETYLETGALGLALILLFLIWWARESAALWRIDHAPPLARAATIAAGAILTHSLVDYPLRTAAIAALFACCCALILGARPYSAERAHAPDPARHLSVD